MNLSIDASILLFPYWSGVQVYAYNILDQMLQIGADHRFTLHFDGAGTSEGIDSLLARPNAARLTRQGTLRYHGLLPLDLLRLRSRAYYSLSSRLKTRLPCPAAFVLHDIGFLLHPRFYAPAHAEEMARRTRTAARAASLIVTVSESVKAEIAEALRFDPARIIVAPNAASPPLREAGSAGLPGSEFPGYSSSSPSGADRPYFLMVNPGRPNKNWENALRAFARYREAHSEDDARLVLTGDLRHEQEKLDKLQAELKLGDSLVLTGYVDDATLNGLYDGARAFLFPSWYEGFGIPILEAMQHGTPVIASDIPVHREVASDAALFVPPAYPEAMAEGMTRLMSDESLRVDLIAKGRTRATHYTWRNSAEITLNALLTA